MHLNNDDDDDDDNDDVMILFSNRNEKINRRRNLGYATTRSKTDFSTSRQILNLPTHFAANIHF